MWTQLLHLGACCVSDDDWLFHAQMQNLEGRDRQKTQCKRESVWNNAGPKRTPGSFFTKTAAINRMQIMKVMNWLL